MFSNKKKYLVDKIKNKIIHTDEELEDFQNVFRFDTSVPSDSWNVYHNFDSYNIMINVFVYGIINIENTITIKDSNTIVVDFDGACTGYVNVIYFGDTFQSLPVITPSASSIL